MSNSGSRNEAWRSEGTSGDAAGYRIEALPRDVEWGDRFFHITDPDGHELSFAWPLKRG